MFQQLCLIQKNWTSQSYNATALGYKIGLAAESDGNATGYALRSYWRPDGTGTATPEVSVGYDTKSADKANDGSPKEGDSYFVGLTWRDMFQADDRIGVAFTQPLKATALQGGGAVGEVDPFIWEAYYSFRPNDSTEVRPAVFGGTDVKAQTDDDIFGVVLTTIFKF